MGFSQQHIAQIKSKGLNLKKVEHQILLFKTGVPFVNLKKAATINDGISKLSKSDEAHYRNLFKKHQPNKNIVKFVPASGAATRMFKFLFEFLQTYQPSKQTLQNYINTHKATALKLFFEDLKKFPFYDNVNQKIEQTIANFSTLPKTQQQELVVKTILAQDGLDYGNAPKGLLPFHKYKNKVCSAFEEHLFEATHYACSNHKTHIHFTILKQHASKFEKDYKRIKTQLESDTKTILEVSFSYQKPETDTIAVQPDNTPFTDSNNKLLFRPSGHGALIENLNDINADIIFIKNIDNVVTSAAVHLVSDYKKIMGGLLIDLQTKIFYYLSLLNTALTRDTTLKEIIAFATNNLNIYFPEDFETYSSVHKIRYLIQKLDRPIRVCGMVINKGQPGGGPFWVKDDTGNVSLQIVESAQIDISIKAQKNILHSATHFNPVDIVCGTKNYKGEKFELNKFVDHNSAFITTKTKEGKAIKALELPGLWNGAMADWNSVFIEVPAATFNPVKTVNDLLNPTHQAT